MLSLFFTDWLSTDNWTELNRTTTKLDSILVYGWTPTELLIYDWTDKWIWVLCHDRRSVGQSISEYSTHMRPKTRFLLLSGSCGFVDVGRSLWRKDGSVVYNWCWSSPAQSYSGPSPVGLATIFYCLRFENFLFVASYDSQGYGGGIRPCLHTRSAGLTNQSQSHTAADGRSISKSWCRASSGAHDQMSITVWHLWSEICECPLWREDRFVFCISCWPLPAQSF
jgi:hypothetical protein